jgi:hypothetical protein
MSEAILEFCALQFGVVVPLDFFVPVVLEMGWCVSCPELVNLHGREVKSAQTTTSFQISTRSKPRKLALFCIGIPQP